ncbi:transcriptional regulator [Heliomicrobium modesticaldum Ice1]|uniref:Stage 0 sporulation protein A homolog n=1 Tax=Heliobacterium modesticaldum (strain ATCC 51547 / Ice1) TaxID=498761 RepID=B0TGI0_HELMI|nr:response regulator transcription factor [Heliomicrobium modesticaldum]ABZ83241.1 transcriptional regulator [Heliomicrobium modesticaldum Ice1]
MAGEKIMIVDDEAVVHELLTHYLEREGFKVFSVYSGSHVLDKTAFHKPDLILLDILLPGLDGIEICHELRKKTDVPIIFITSRDAPHEVALGLGIGGDDYVKKPFNPVEVVARVRAQLRRFRKQCALQEDEPAVLAFGDLRINLFDRTVEMKGERVELTVKEYDLLLFLAQNPNRYFSSDQLIEAVWNHPRSISQKALMTHISNLRRKLGEDPDSPRYIATLKGVGYMFSSR